MTVSVHLANAPRGSSKLLNIIVREAKATTKAGARRRIVVLTCYFDVHAVWKVVEAIGHVIRSQKRGIITGVTVAVDVGEWIREPHAAVLAKGLSHVAGVPQGEVKVVPVQLSGRLLHAKAYAAIPDGDAEDGEGFLVVTSGNATERGLGLSAASNVELAMATRSIDAVRDFERSIALLTSHPISLERQLRQDKYLRGLALFASGAFFHRWTHSLGSETRFSLTLTMEGKARAKSGAFPGYNSESDTISRDPIGLERIYDEVPRVIPPAFWKNFSVDTTLGRWVPIQAAEAVEDRQKPTLAPYLARIAAMTSPASLANTKKLLTEEVSTWNKAGWVTESVSAVHRWEKRVARFRRNEALISQCLRPYTRISGEVLDGLSRAVVLEAIEHLEAQLGWTERNNQTKLVVEKFLEGKMTREDMHKALARVSSAAETLLGGRPRSPGKRKRRRGRPGRGATSVK